MKMLNIFPNNGFEKQSEPILVVRMSKTKKTEINLNDISF